MLLKKVVKSSAKLIKSDYMGKQNTGICTAWAVTSWSQTSKSGAEGGRWLDAGVVLVEEQLLPWCCLNSIGRNCKKACASLWAESGDVLPNNSNLLWGYESDHGRKGEPMSWARGRWCGSWKTASSGGQRSQLDVIFSVQFYLTSSVFPARLWQNLPWKSSHRKCMSGICGYSHVLCAYPRMRSSIF